MQVQGLYYGVLVVRCEPRVLVNDMTGVSLIYG
jgi:hypothetical protein